MNVIPEDKSTVWYRRLSRPGSGGVDFIFAGLARGGGAPFAFLANIIIARFLGPDKYGIYITILSASLVAGVIASYGVGPVLTREIAAHPEQQRRALVLATGKWALRFTSVLSICAMAIVLAWLSFGPGSPPSIWLERIAAICVIPMYVWAILSRSVLSGMSSVAKGQAIENIWKNALLLIGVTLLLLMGLHRVADVLWLQALSFALASLIGTYWIYHAVQPDSNRVSTAVITSIAESDVKVLYRDWRKSAGHFFSMSIAILVLARLDVVIVNAIAGPTQAGLFGAAARLGQMAIVAGLIWMAWLQPRMASQWRQGHTSDLKRSLYHGIVGSVSMTGILVFIGWLLAPQLMLTLGNGFDGAVGPFRWLLLGSLLWGLSVPFYVLLTMSAHEKLVSWILWVQVALTLAASIPLAAHFGALGAAWAWAGGTGIASLILVVAGLFVRTRPSTHD